MIVDWLWLVEPHDVDLHATYQEPSRLRFLLGFCWCQPRRISALSETRRFDFVQVNVQCVNESYCFIIDWYSAKNSEQQLTACASSVAPNDGCNGGWPGSGWTYIQGAGGLATSAAIPYASAGGTSVRILNSRITRTRRIPSILHCSRRVLLVHRKEWPKSAAGVT